MQAAFLSFALGGTKAYEGNSNMTSAHARLVPKVLLDGRSVRLLPHPEPMTRHVPVICRVVVAPPLCPTVVCVPQGLRIKHFDIVLEHLGSALTDMNVPQVLPHLPMRFQNSSWIMLFATCWCDLAPRLYMHMLLAHAIVTPAWDCAQFSALLLFVASGGDC